MGLSPPAWPVIPLSKTPSRFLLRLFCFIWGFQRLSFVFAPLGITFCALSFEVVAFRLRLPEALVCFRASGDNLLRSFFWGFCVSYVYTYVYTFVYTYVYTSVCICIYIFGSFSHHFGVTLGSLRGHFGVTLGSLWGHFGFILGLFWDLFGFILRSL